jgi:uncharacterized integral membrane protein
MQIFLFGALAISRVAVVFALQNIVPVRVTVLTYLFEGSLALGLFVTLVSGALISFLASVPTLGEGRWETRDLRRQVAALEAQLAERPRPSPATEMRPAVEARPAPAPADPVPGPAAPSRPRPDDPTEPGP